MKDQIKLPQVIASSHHRNGVSGHPFTVALIKDEDGSLKVAIRLDQQADKDTGFCCCAVLDVEMLSKGIVEFGVNSWRGDHYAHLIDAPELQPFGPMITGGPKRN